MKKILIIGQNSIADPHNGGQKRTSAIVQKYKDLGYLTRYVGIYPEIFFDKHGQYDIFIREQAALDAIAKSYSILVTGIGFRAAISLDSNAQDQLAAFIKNYQPDAIEFEQPYLFHPIQKILKKMGYTGKIIYSSYDIEYDLRKQMIDDAGTLPRWKKFQVLKEVKNIEKYTMKGSDLSIAVKPEDADYMRKIGAEKVIIAPNGIDIPQHSKKMRLKKQDGKYQVLFVGSGHKPNYTGFVNMMGYDLSFLHKDMQLIVAGQVSDIIRSNINSFIHVDNMVLLGRISEKDLTETISSVDLIILPITSGGGSNLKTAEALVSGKQILATLHAFRGYEIYRNISGVTIEDNPEKFRELLVQLNKEKPPKRTAKEKELIKGVLWENTLRSLDQIRDTI